MKILESFFAAVALAVSFFAGVYAEKHFETSKMESACPPYTWCVKVDGGWFTYRPSEWGTVYEALKGLQEEGLAPGGRKG